MIYIRFVVGQDGEHHRELNGIFTELRILRDDGHLEPYESERLEEIFDWFNDNLPCPPYSSNRWGVNATSWFKESALVYIDRMWDFVAILEEHGVPVRMLRSRYPGIVLYEDDFQVVVEEYEHL